MLSAAEVASMTVLGKNVLISTSRSVTSTVNGKTVTGAATAHLSQVKAHIRTTVGIFHALPAGALTSEYRARVDAGTDIMKGDFITAITLMDGTTPWPGLTFSSTPGTNESWHVVEALEAFAGQLPCRYLFLVREVGGGPVY